MSRTERLKNWIRTLDSEKQIHLLAECIEELIDAETVNFYEDTKVPYWDGNGERLDGSEWEEDED
jgi:hypothetical protein